MEMLASRGVSVRLVLAVIHHAVIREGLRPLSGPLYSHLRGLQMEGLHCHYLQPTAPNLGFRAHCCKGKIRLDLTCTQASDLDKCEVPAARG